MKIFHNMVTAVLISITFHPVTVNGSDQFSTWEGFEADKCASVWLIKHYIAPQGLIHIYPRGEILKEGIPFDTPEAIFRRYYNKSTFETLREHYKINDSRVIYIGRIIHDIEVNIWGKKIEDDTRRVMREVKPFILSEDSSKTMAGCIDYFSNFYDNLKLN